MKREKDGGEDDGTTGTDGTSGTGIGKTGGDETMTGSEPEVGAAGAEAGEGGRGAAAAADDKVVDEGDA